VLPLDYAPAADPHDGPGEPLVESVWVDPFPDEQVQIPEGLAGPEARYEQRESVELAFIAALQNLQPRQRAVLILREVLGFSGDEVAQALDTTPAAVYSALQRAHAAVDGRLPERSQQATLHSLDDRELREVVDGFVDAWERDDVDALAAMLTEDAVIAMPPMPTWFSGREAVGAFLRGWPLSGRMRWHLVPTRANGQLAFGAYRWDAERKGALFHSITLLTLEGRRIKDITAFLTPEIFERFGLPAEIRR
jgi:RNA polymerase sigma-70 factor (ECF subfamily)